MGGRHKQETVRGQHSTMDAESRIGYVWHVFASPHLLTLFGALDILKT